LAFDRRSSLMPVRDHFPAPLYPARPWESFHSRWANAIADALNAILPRRYVSEVLLRLGSMVGADVAEFQRTDEPSEEEINGPAGGVALQTYAPPVATQVMPAVFPDDLEVQVIDQLDDARLVAVVELVSPRNKDRTDARRGFAAKSAAYLQRGVGVMIVDVVTHRHANLHNELVRLLGLAEEFLMPEQALLYAVAYRPVRRGESDQIDLWPTALTVGEVLPTLPLGLRGTRPVPVDLEATYLDACQRARL
jgi:hypothetical protein